MTLRSRLSARYCALIITTFALTAVGLYQALAWGLRRDLDAGLLSQAREGAAVSIAALEGTSTSGESSAAPLNLSRLSTALLRAGRYAQLVDRNGVVIAATPTLLDGPLPTPPAPLLRALAGSRAYATIWAGGGQKLETYSPYPEELRAIFYPLAARTFGPVALEIATPILGVSEALRKVRFLLWMIAPALMLIASLAGLGSINGILRRVDEMAGTAQRIGAENLDERLVERGPDEIGRLGEVFNEMLDRLSLAFNRMRQFTADASHELKTPLTSLRGDAEVGLMRERRPAEYQQILARVVEESERMSGIVDSLLLLARVDGHSASPRSDLIEAADLVKEVTDSCRGIADRSQIEIETHTPAGLLLLGDPLFLRQMLNNLVENAVKYTPPGGFVWVSASAAGKCVLLVVEDTGPGIPIEHRVNIFDRFYRVDSSHSSSTGGSGLGLAIALAITRDHRGDIQVSESSRGGARFEVTLPAAPSDPNE